MALRRDQNRSTPPGSGLQASPHQKNGVFGNLCGWEWEEGARLWIQQALGGVEAFRLGGAILGSVNGHVRCKPRSSPTRNPEARKNEGKRGPAASLWGAFAIVRVCLLSKSMSIAPQARATRSSSFAGGAQRRGFRELQKLKETRKALRYELPLHRTGSYAFPSSLRPSAPPSLLHQLSGPTEEPRMQHSLSPEPQ